MTAPVRPGKLRTSLLVDEDAPALAAFLDRDRAGTVYLRSLAYEYGVSPSDRMGHGRTYGAWRRGRLVAVTFLGNARNFTTWGETGAVEALLDRAVGPARGPRLFVGPEEHADLVRGVFSRTDAYPVLDRAQAYYVLRPETLAEVEPVPIRPARVEDLDPVTAAHAAMTEEDLHIPRERLDLLRLREMSRARIEAEKVWVVMEGGHLVFKTEEAGRSEDAALVGGVYTDPAYRGRGYATRGLATWARHHFTHGLSLLALHVAADNVPAVRAYERTGFRRHSMLRLMLAY